MKCGEKGGGGGRKQYRDVDTYRSCSLPMRLCENIERGNCNYAKYVSVKEGEKFTQRQRCPEDGTCWMWGSPGASADSWRMSPAAGEAVLQDWYGISPGTSNDERSNPFAGVRTRNPTRSGEDQVPNMVSRPCGSEANRRPMTWVECQRHRVPSALANRESGSESTRLLFLGIPRGTHAGCLRSTRLLFLGIPRRTHAGRLKTRKDFALYLSTRQTPLCVHFHPGRCL
jgi:hypothetical protein